MAATILDLSRRGDQGFALPGLFADMADELVAWMAAANAQNPTQLLSVITGPDGAPGYCGWTIKARLAVLSGGQPVQLMGQWVANLTTAAVTTQMAEAAGYAAGPALGGHGVLTGGTGTANSLITLAVTPLPLVAVVATSLSPGQEYFCFAFSQHSFTNRQAAPLLIAKDVISGQWHLAQTDMSGVLGMVGWNTARPQVQLSTVLRSDWSSSSLPLALTRPAQWMPMTPTVSYVVPLPPVQWWDPVVMPADLALYNRTLTTFGYFKASDGSEWLQIGPWRLAVRVKDPTA